MHSLFFCTQFFIFFHFILASICNSCYIINEEREGRKKIKFEITCNAYCINPHYQFEERHFKIEQQHSNDKYGFVNAVKIKVRALSATEDGIINAWTECNTTQVPDIYVFADDMITIKLIDEEK